MQGHKHDGAADKNFIKQLDPLDDLETKHLFGWYINFSPLQDPFEFKTFYLIKLDRSAGGQHLGLGAICMDPSGGKPGRRCGVTDLHAALIAASLNTIARINR